MNSEMSKKSNRSGTCSAIMPFYGILGGAAGAAFGYMNWAPMLGYTQDLPRLIITVGVAMTAYQIGVALDSGQKGLAEAAGAAFGLMLVGQYFLAPVLNGAIQQQWLSALLLGPAVGLIVGLVATDILASWFGSSLPSGVRTMGCGAGTGVCA